MRAGKKVHNKRGTGYHSFTPERPKAWRNNKDMYALVCVDVFTKKADMEPMKDKESNTCNKAMDNVFDRLGIPETIYSDEGSEFTNNKFIQLLEKHKIENIYATNHAPVVESFKRTMKRMMDRYMEAYDISSWTTIYRDLLKHSSTGFAPNDIIKKKHRHSQEEYKETWES
jgi:hypothetical protein